MTRRQLAISLTIASCLWVLPVLHASASDERELAAALVKSLLFEEQLESGKRKCQDRASYVDVEAILALNPSLFLHTNLSSHAWPKVREAYIAYAQKLCLPAIAELYSERAELVYASHLSSEELQEVIKFMESPTGRKFAGASSEITAQVNDLMLIEAEGIQSQAWGEYENRVLEMSKNEVGPVNPEQSQEK